MSTPKSNPFRCITLLLNQGWCIFRLDSDARGVLSKSTIVRAGLGRSIGFLDAERIAKEYARDNGIPYIRNAYPQQKVQDWIVAILKGKDEHPCL